MSTEAQLAANKANAQHSTGPKTPEGKAASCQNNFRHGFTGQFTVLPSEDPSEYQSLLADLQSEHQPATFTEHVLVERMAQHHWLRDRACCCKTSLSSIQPAAGSTNARSPSTCATKPPTNAPSRSA
jgi:hypothetical protein